MTSRLGALRVRHVKQSIVSIRNLLRGRSFEDARSDEVAWAAFERFLEILSEASRHIPDDWKTIYGSDIPWGKVGDLGNALRHTYHRADRAILWSTYTDDLTPLEAVIDAMLAAYDAPEA